jgi:O-antigen/teichoic acid export membrane protein
VASLVVIVVLANALGADGYGRYTTLIALSALISVFADLGFSPLYTREAARGPDALGRYLGTLLVLKLALAAAASVILSLALSYGVGLTSLILPGAALMVLTAYANLLRNTFYAVGRAGFEAIAVLAEISIQATLILYGAHVHAAVGFYVWAYAASFAFTCL